MLPILFNDTIIQLVDYNKGERFYFAAASMKPVNEAGQYLHIVAYKEAGLVRVIAEYFDLNNTKSVEKINKLLTPAKFEELINGLATTIAVEQSDNRLIELTYKAAGLSNSDIARLDDKTREMLTKAFILVSARYKDTQKGYDFVNDALRNPTAQYIEGQFLSLMGSL